MTQGSGSAAFNFGGGTLGAVASWSSPLNINLSGIGGPATIDTTGGNIILSGNLTGTSGLIKIDSGELVLADRTATAAGPTFDAGILSLSSATALAEGTSLTIGEDATPLLLFGALPISSPASDSMRNIASRGRGSRAGHTSAFGRRCDDGFCHHLAAGCSFKRLLTGEM